MWPSLDLHQDPLLRPCPKCQPQVPRHRYSHVISKVPAQCAVATEMVGMGHSWWDKRRRVTGLTSRTEFTLQAPPAPGCPLTEPTVFATEAHRAVTAEATPAL